MPSPVHLTTGTPPSASAPTLRRDKTGGEAAREPQLPHTSILVRLYTNDQQRNYGAPTGAGRGETPTGGEMWARERLPALGSEGKKQLSLTCLLHGHTMVPEESRLFRRVS